MAAISEPPLAVPDSILPGASEAVVRISVLLLHRFWAILGGRFRIACKDIRIEVFEDTSRESLTRLLQAVQSC